jgi:hypothetical protein
MYHIVISRYNESLAWLDFLTEEQKAHVLVYNKGPDDISFPVNEKLPNVGREGHTYLWYIIQNYDRLPEQVIFLQADPFDHFKFEAKNMSNVLNNWIRQVKWNGITSGSLVREFGFDVSRTFRIGEYKGFLYRSKMNFGEWWDHFIGKDVGHPEIIHRNGCFGVSRDLIRTRDVEYYKKILDDVSVHNNPESGHYLERSWHYIFNGYEYFSFLTKLQLSVSVFLLIFLCVLYFFI